MIIIEIFKQFVAKINLKQDLKNIINFSNAIKDKQKGIKKSNCGGFHSNDLKKNDPAIVSLVKEIEFYSNIIAKEVLKISPTLKVDNIWVNINGFKDFNIMHKHSSYKISGVFYVNVPKNSGDLICVNDTEIENYIVDILEFNPYNSSINAIIPEENTLYLFPSWLKHYVQPNLSKEKRISISFNLK
jgi:uncharacterized protein (TIGR02466 family)